MKRVDEHINVGNIQMFEIVTLTGEDKYYFYRIYSTGHSVIEFTSRLVPINDVLVFCSEHNISTTPVTIELNVFRVILKFGHVIIEYYGKEEKTIKIPANDILRIELEIFHPVSITRHVYKIITTGQKVFEFEYAKVDDNVLKAYARKKGFPVIEKILY